MIRSIIHTWYQKTIRRFNPGSLILMYHRINKEDLDPWGLCVTPENFESQIRIIKRFAEIVSLDELLFNTMKKASGDRLAAITFDDGYADNFYFARPILESYSIPATFFISAGNVMNNTHFWWDELQSFLLQPGVLPDKFTLKLDNKTFHWELQGASEYSEDEYYNDFGIKANKSKTGSRMNFYYQLWKTLFPMKPYDKKSILLQIADWSGTIKNRFETHRPLTMDELKCLADNHSFEIGAHCVNHPVLSKYSRSEQLSEIKEGRDFLESFLKRNIRNFAYPHGEFSEITSGLVEEEGFNSACTTDFGALRSISLRYKLPRIQVENWNEKQFKIKFNNWFYI